MKAGFSAHIVGGVQSLMREISKASKAAENAAVDAMVETAYAIQGDAVKLIHGGTKTGRIYETGKSGRNHRGQFLKKGANGKRQHRASAPGEAPASDTGKLASSIRVTVDRSAGTAKVIARTPYAAHLEFGTTKMAPRPFMSVAFLMNKGLISKTTRAKWRANFTPKD